MTPLGTTKHPRNEINPRSPAVRALIRLLLLGFPIVFASSMLSDGGVEAGEAKSIRLPGPSMIQTELPRARVIAASKLGSFEVMRNQEEQAGPVTVVTGFRCDKWDQACNRVSGGAFLDAAALIREEIAAGKDNAAIRCGLGSTLFLEGDLAGAARAYAWAAAGFPRDPDIRNGLGNVFAELSQIDQAVEEFSELATHPGYSAVAHNNLGNVYRKANRFAEALSEYNRAIQEDPNLVAAHYNQAGILLQMGSYSEAANSFRETAAHAPKFGDSYLYEGLSRMRAKEPVLAAVALYRARELGLDNPAANLGLAVVCQELKLDGEAVEHFRRVLSTNPQEEKVYQMLSVSLVRLGRLDEAADSLETGFQYGNQDANAHFFLGLKLILCEKPEKASRYLMRAVSKGRRDSETFFALGQSLLQSGELEGAIRTLSLAARLKPEAPEIHLALGIAMHFKKDPDNAIREVRAAATIDPTDPHNRMILLDFLQDKADFSECAREGAQLVDDFPELVAPRFETAFCQGLSGKLDQAAETIEDALDQDTDGTAIHKVWKKLSLMVESGKNLPAPHLLLALINERRGNWSDAIYHFERFLLTSPSGEWSRRALQRIHSLAPSP